ncbi:hypothetical protein I4U23_011331 [Adineta vaga]|nr:hypothetical protein I4U23_011331 [Adineta vaga]
MKFHTLKQLNEDTNLAEESWICDQINITSTATFDFCHPPIIIASIKPLAKRDEEGYDANHVRLRDMKNIVKIGSVEYKLRAVIHHKSAHFTATVIGTDNMYYYFDDQKGIRQGRPSTDLVEFDTCQREDNYCITVHKISEGHEFQPLYKLKKNQKKSINSTITMLSSPIPDRISKNTIQDLTELFKSLYPLMLLIISVFLSIAAYFGKKCYQNEGKCKKNWYKIKSPTEYGRRREINQQRKVVLDQIIAHSFLDESIV